MRVLMMTQRVDADHDILGFTVDWVAALADHVDRLDVLTGYEGRHDLPDNVHIRSYGKERGYGRYRRIAAFERHCASLVPKADGVFVHMIPKYVIAGWPWFAAARTPVVMWYAHSEVDTKLRVAHALVDAVVTPTEASFRLPSEKLHVVGHGIDTDRFNPGEPETERDLLLALGRIDPVKGFDTVVDAASVLVGRGRDVRLRIVGEPSAAATGSGYLDSLRDRVKEAGIADQVTFAGRVPHGAVMDEYRRAGVFLNASNTGSLDKVEIEAMACGTPVISSNDSYREMVQESGLDVDSLTFAGGDATALADCIDDILRLDPEAYRMLGSLSRDVVVRMHGVDGTMRRVAELLAGHAD